MSLILNIDTATEVATVSISQNDKVLKYIINNNQKDHASFLQPAIKTLLQQVGISISDLAAIAVTQGPGSYTGLRVGMASAKGLCYALNIPMIAINTLEVIALSCIDDVKDRDAVFCPMIDARRMEVFTAVYNADLAIKLAPCSMILDKASFEDLLQTDTIYFTGSGASKAEALFNIPNAVFEIKETSPGAMAQLSYNHFKSSLFANVMSSAPLYIKEFHTVTPPVKT